MATGVTSSITSDTSFTSRYQLTADDDTLIISGATVTLKRPQGDIFTNEGNDNVTIDESVIVAEREDLMLFLGSGDDTLTVRGTTFDAPVWTGSGNDIVIVEGAAQNKVRLNKELIFGAGDDILELVSMLENAGSIDFGSSGTGTLRFNGGALLPVQITGTTNYGTIGSFTNLDVTIAGGTTGSNLTLSGEQTAITLNGNLTGTANNKTVSVSGGTTTLTVGTNARTNLRLSLNNVQLVHADGSILEFSDHTGYAVTADDSVIELHDIVTKGGQGLTGSNTDWTVLNCDFSNTSGYGIYLTGGSIDFQSCGITNCMTGAFFLISATLTGKKLSFVSNNIRGALRTDGAIVEITDFRANGNYGSGWTSRWDGVRGVYVSTCCGNGAAICQSGGTMTLTSATFSGNSVTSMGGAIYQSGGTMTLTSATFSGNSAGGYGGAIYQSGGTMTLISAAFSGNSTGSVGGALCINGGVMTLSNATINGNYSPTRGAVYFERAIANMEDVAISNNSGGAALDVYNATTLNYVITSGRKITNVANTGGWLYINDKASTVNITVGNDGVLTIGNASRSDAISGGASGCEITKNGTGYMLVNSDIGGYQGKWTVADGTLELARIARTLKLDDWTIGTNATLILSVQNDTINMSMSKKIGTIDMGGGADTINTNKYDLTEGMILLSDLTLGGGGMVSAKLRNRSETEGSTLRLNGIILDSEFTGNDYTDTILINQESTLNGAIDLGNGDNEISAKALATFNNTLTMGSGNDTLTMSGTAKFEKEVSAGSGNDTLTFADVTFGGDIDLGDGNNTMTVGIAEKKPVSSGGGGDETVIIGGTLKMQGISGGSGDDTIILNGESMISGEVALGGGENAIHVGYDKDGTVLTADKFKITEGGKTTVYVYLGNALAYNSLTVYSDEEAARDHITLSWADQTDLNKVRILVSSDSSFQDEKYEFAVELYNKSKSFTLDLQQGYFIQFQANDEDGWKQRLLDDHVAPNQVTGLNFNGSVLTWDETHDNLGGNGVKQYHVEVATDASFTNVIASEIVTGTQYAPATLAESTLYFRVNAEDYTNNIGAWSETVSGIFDNTPPSRPTGGKSAVDGYAVNLSWSASTDTGSGVAQYEYRIATDSTYGQIVTSGTTEACSITVDNLKYGIYYWQVKSIDAAGNESDWSLSKNFATVDSIAPVTPTNLDYGIEDGSTLSVIWDAVTDDALGSGLNRYEIQLASDADFATIVEDQSSTVPGITIRDLGKGTYYMRVCAVDNVGNKSAWTDTETFIIDVDTTPPTITNIQASITEPTNLNVIVTATFSDNVAVETAQYRIGPNGAWKDYKNGVTVTENTTVYFKAVDTSGNASAEVPFVVSNIDKTPPETPTAAADITTPTRGAVTVTAMFSEDSVIREYSTDGQTWAEYTNPIVFDTNGTVFFRGTDAVGNVSEATPYTVSNIDTVAPEKPTASADITAPTNQNVTVTATFSDDSYKKEYSIDGKVWMTYSAGVTMEDNGTVYFRGTDEAGNVSDVTDFLVSNIDRIAPEKPTASANITEATRQNVQVTAVFSDDSVIREYSMDGEDWRAYTKPIWFMDNGSVSFRGADEAGNVSESTVYVVDNIISVPLDAPVLSVDVTAPTRGTVTVSATYSEIAAVKQYSVDGVTWLDYNGPLSFADNGFVVFLCTDASGECAYTAYAVTNIDKVAPEQPGAYATATAPTNRDVTVKAMFSNDTSTKEFSLDGTTWLDYTDGIVFEENGMVFFRGADAAGNVSKVTKYEVTNIDKVAPEKPTVSANITTITNTPVTVSAAFSQDSVIREYSLDGENWSEYTESIEFMENGMGYFRGTDEAGNVSSVANYAVVVIDTDPPVAPVASADITTPTNSSVHVSAVFSGDSVKKEYSLDQEKWWDYTGPVEFTENGTVYFRGIDEAGNISDVTSYVVSNIEDGPIEKIRQFFTGDFNGDGKALLAVQSDSTVTIYQNGEAWGNGLVLDDGWSIAGVGDFNGDSFDDFLRVHTSGLVIGEMSDGTGTFSPQVLNFKSDGWSILGTGNFDGVGADDVLIANPTAASETVGLLGYWKSGTEWTLINGYSPEWTMVSTGDFNGDGKCDMLWKNSFVGEGDLTYNAYCTWIVDDPVDWRMVSVANPDEWNFLCSGDFDGDKMNDIAMINDVGVVGIWGVNDGYLSSWSILSAVTPEWQLAGVADFNADGTDDIAWSNTDTGLVGAWQIENKELASWQTIASLG